MMPRRNDESPEDGEGPVQRGLSIVVTGFFSLLAILFVAAAGGVLNVVLWWMPSDTDRHYHHDSQADRVLNDTPKWAWSRFFIGAGIGATMGIGGVLTLNRRKRNR